jgi:hypothetical protein
MDLLHSMRIQMDLLHSMRIQMDLLHSMRIQMDLLHSMRIQMDLLHNNHTKLLHNQNLTWLYKANSLTVLAILTRVHA